MATTKKSKKMVFASPIDLQEHSIDPAPASAMQAPPEIQVQITNDMMQRVEIARVMEKEYGRYRHDLAGLLWSILGELVARRVNK